MPKMFLHYPEGVFSQGSLDALAEEVTTIGLQCEGLPDTLYVRSNIWFYAQEYPAGRVYHGGEPLGTKVMSLEVNVVGGALQAEARTAMIERFTKAVGRHAGIAEGDRVPLYIVIRDVPPSSWGMFGKAITLEGLHHPPADAKPV